MRSLLLTLSIVIPISPIVWEGTTSAVVGNVNSASRLAEVNDPGARRTVACLLADSRLVLIDADTGRTMAERRLATGTTISAIGHFMASSI
ncbi:MAG: hypothetical protein AABN33_29250 [Acidobacteriota bacterium]